MALNHWGGEVEFKKEVKRYGEKLKRMVMGSPPSRLKKKPRCQQSQKQ